MDLILKEVENARRTECYLPDYDGITYVATLTEDITPNELESASKIVYYAITNMFEYSIEVFLKLLKENHRKSFVSFPNNETYKIYVKSKWLFQVILLCATKNLNVLNQRGKIDNSSIEFLRVIVLYIVKYVFIEKPGSIHLLRTLLLILNKRTEVLTPELSFIILKTMDRVALSPIPCFKHYAHSISKTVLPSLSRTERDMFLDIDMLPIRGVDTFDVVKMFPNKFVKENVKRIIKKVLKLFLNNVENKDGSVLYDTVLIYSFYEWKTAVWPLLVGSLEVLECEGEFFQSLIKYWIPSNVRTYRSDFYMFLKHENIDDKLRAYVLLESKKKGFVDQILFSDDVLPFFYNTETTTVGLKILSTYHKKSLCPQIAEITVVQNFLQSNLNTTLAEDDVKSLCSFFSQIFLHAHVILKKNKGGSSNFAMLMENVYKYCRFCLDTDKFEVAAQIVFILNNIATGSYKNLKLNYKVEQRDMYEMGGNLLYKQLREENVWKFDTEEFYSELKKCFLKNKGDGTNLRKLAIIYADKISFVDVKGFRGIVNAEAVATLQNTERIKNYADVVFGNTENSVEVIEFVKEIVKFLSTNLDLTRHNYSNEGVLYKNVVYFEVILVAMKNHTKIDELHVEIEKALDVVNVILEQNYSGNGSYKTAKVLEAFINSIMYCISLSKNSLWLKVVKTGFISNLIRIVQRSNMKRPVSLTVEVLKQFGSIMEEVESDRILKIQVLDATLKSIYKNPVKQELRIRRSPESRLVIHALCSSEKNQCKPLLKWTLNFLIDIITDPTASDSSISSALHSIEILICDNALQTHTLPFVSDICVKSIELFAKPSWVVRNADLQLAKALIERFYGVSLSLDNRPKNVEDFFLLFPELSVYFFKILCLEQLDDRSILVFQFFFESQVREHTFKHDLTGTTRDGFLAVFSGIIKKYPNDYGKLAVRSYVSLCVAKNIPKVVVDVVEYIKNNFRAMQKNIFANFAFLLKELCEKYINSFLPGGILSINLAVEGLFKFLRQFASPLFDFLSIKLKTVNSVLVFSNDSFEKRLWMHNNLPFALINAESKCVSDVLDELLTNSVLGCVQIKMLAILVRRLEKNEFNTEEGSKIVEILLKVSALVDNSERYLLNSYFKTILIFCEKYNPVVVSKIPITYNQSDDLYKIMIYVIYYSKQAGNPGSDFYKIAETTYSNSIGINDEIDNDILSTLRYFKQGAPKRFSPSIFKLAFYGAVRYPTHMEAYNFISWLKKRAYTSLLMALKDFLSMETLSEHMEGEDVIKKFFIDVGTFVDSLPDCPEVCSGYYSVESDSLVSKLFLKKLLQFSLENT